MYQAAQYDGLVDPSKIQDVLGISKEEAFAICKYCYLFSQKIKELRLSFLGAELKVMSHEL